MSKKKVEFTNLPTMLCGAIFEAGIDLVIHNTYAPAEVKREKGNTLMRFAGQLKSGQKFYV